MKPIVPITLLALLLVPGLPGRAAETNSSKSSITARIDLESFRIITERNIFDPDRSARGGDARNRRREREPRVRTESFALVGTLSYEKGRFAFFDGTASDYHKVLQSSQSIAGFTVASVAPTCVRLENTNGQTIDLCVGMQMSKREDEPWQLSERSTSSESTGAGTGTGGASATGGGGSDEVLKRLMQRREQEGNPAAAAADTNEPAKDSEPAPAAAKPTAAPGDADGVLQRLLQKREQETNK